MRLAHNVASGLVGPHQVGGDDEFFYTRGSGETALLTASAMKIANPS